MLSSTKHATIQQKFVKTVPLALAIITESVSQDMNPKNLLAAANWTLMSKGVAVEIYRVSVAGFLQQEKKEEKKGKQISWGLQEFGKKLRKMKGK